MHRLILREYQRTTAVQLTTNQRDRLADIAKVDVRPVTGRTDAYDLTPGATVGTVVVDGLQVEIHPKVELDRLLFLISYVLDPVRWHDRSVELQERDTLVTAMARMWVTATRQALRRGLLQGYRHREESLATVRGRVRIPDQIRDRFGLMPPVEVAFDDFTTDIDENRLLATAGRTIARLPLQGRLRDAFSGVRALLAEVPSVRYDPGRLPDIEYSRLNEHYRQAVELSKLIIAASTLELGSPGHRGQSFLVNINDVFERFLHAALSEALSRGRLHHERPVHLDVSQRVPMKPDLTWTRGDQAAFVADAKYKALKDQDARNADLYQLLAYVVALDLPSGMLVHSAGEGLRGHHDVVELGRRLHVEWLDISGEPTEILADVHRLASRIDAIIASSEATSTR